MNNSLPICNDFGSVTLSKLSETHPCLNIQHKTCEAKVSLFGGHVLNWQPTDEKEVFWISKDAKYDEKSAIRGGIPICWPWFGTHERNGVKGNHGFARNLIWQLSDVELTENVAKITLTLEGENHHNLWPERYRLKQVLSFGKDFEQSLFITNMSDQPVEYTTALHSYFSVGSPENCTVSVLNGAKFEDKLTGEKCDPALLESCKGPLDRIYQTNETAIIEDDAWQRKIRVTPTNTNQWVLWNPGSKIAGQMVDIHVGGENEYVCLEAANTRWCEIKAHETVVIGQQVTLI